jgi:hypothetical protein
MSVTPNSFFVGLLFGSAPMRLSLASFTKAIFNKECSMKKILNLFAQAILMAIAGILLAVLMLEWMAGCGEHYIDAKGITHQNQCLFINLK